jgi:uncharacterized protein (DUF305 family)
MITQNNIASGVVCGIICVAFMWAYMAFFMTGMSMNMNSKVMHQMPDGSMMMNHGSPMDMMNMTMNDMSKMLDGKTGRALEKEFIVGMIPHHRGAVDMAKVLLQDKTTSVEMKKFAEDIIKAQEGEIKMMNAWLLKY